MPGYLLISALANGVFIFSAKRKVLYERFTEDNQSPFTRNSVLAYCFCFMTLLLTTPTLFKHEHVKLV